MDNLLIEYEKSRAQIITWFGKNFRKTFTSNRVPFDA